MQWQNLIRFFLHLQCSLMSHSSHLLISLLLSVGVSVIGYFTHVRVELAEGKGQATRLSVSCTAVIHQLLSGTRKATVALSRHFVKHHPGYPVNPWTRGRVTRADLLYCAHCERVDTNYNSKMPESIQNKRALNTNKCLYHFNLQLNPPKTWRLFCLNKLN